MKGSYLVFILLVLLVGCAGTEETYYLDQEFGQAQMESWDKMIVPPDPMKTEKKPEGMEGIHAESAIGVYHGSFSKKPTETNIIQFGITGK